MRNQRTTHAAIDSHLGANALRSPGCASKTQQQQAQSRRKVRYALYLGVAGALTTAVLSYPFAVRAAQDAAAGAARMGITPEVSSNPSVSASVDTSLPMPSVMVDVIDGNHPQQSVAVCGRTVGEAIDSLNLPLNALDRVSPALKSPLLPGERIVLTRVRVENETSKAPIPFRTVFRMSHDLEPGKIQAGHSGKAGLAQKTYALTYVNDKLTQRKLVATKVLVPAVDEETLGGIRIRMARALPSRSGAYRRLRCMTMMATGYSPYEGSSSGRCATGMRAGYGVVAVDPRVIRLGTRLYIEGYGYAVAGDTGGAIKGHRIDLGHTTYSEASAVGRQHVKVWVLDSNR